MALLDLLKSIFSGAPAMTEEEKAEQEALKALRKHCSIIGGQFTKYENLDVGVEVATVFHKEGSGRKEKITKLHEFKLDDVVEFKITETEASPNSSNTGTSYNQRMKITLASGEEYRLWKWYTVSDTPSDNPYIRIQERQNVADMGVIICSFLGAIKDNETKAWVNTIYEQDGLLPVFDDNGEFLLDSASQNIATLKSRTV